MKQLDLRETNVETTKTCDVVILDSGLSGTVLGAILARNGLDVIIVDRDTHPRFTVGESTITQTTLTLELLALRYGVPELKNLTSVSLISEHVQPSCGVKLNFGFAYHHKGREQDPKEVNQALVVDECHYFRQDIDAYMLHTAVAYGCRAFHKSQLRELHIDESGVRLQTDRGLKIECKYVVDGTGHSSLLAKQFGLREEPTRNKTHSRGLFTHMINVPPFDECVTRSDTERTPVPLHKGTLHHIFDEGWLWVIPFNNTPQSKNPLISVGLMLDPRKLPRRPSIDPEQEFFDFIAQYPAIARQFKNARAVREWVSSDRIQYSTRACVGDRYCLLSHATGFIDPLFSRGLYNTMQTINVLAKHLIDAKQTGDYGKQRFEAFERMQQDLIDFNDQLVNCSYVSFRKYSLWNAWFRYWLLTSSYGRLRIQRALLKYEQLGDASALESLDSSGQPGCVTDQESIMRLFWDGVKLVESVDGGTLSETEAESKLYALLEANKPLLPTLFNFLDPAQRWTPPNPPDKVRALLTQWVEGMPKSIRDEYFDYPLELLFRRPAVKDASMGVTQAQPARP